MYLFQLQIVWVFFLGGGEGGTRTIDLRIDYCSFLFLGLLFIGLDSIDIIHGLIISANKVKLNKCDFNSVRLNSWVVSSYHVARNMMHVMSTWCVARDLNTIASRPLEHTCWRRFAAQWGDCKKSRIAPFNALLLLLLLLIIIIIKNCGKNYTKIG